MGRVRLKCSTNICESEGLINTIIYCFLISLLVLTIVGFKETHKADENIGGDGKGNSNNTNIQQVFLKCEIYLTDEDRDVIKPPKPPKDNTNNTNDGRSIDSTDSYRSTKLKNSKMKRKYQKENE